MIARLAAPVLVAVAAVLEAAGAGGPARYALIAAVPVAAATALASLGRLVDLPSADARLLAGRVETALAVLGTIALVAAAAVRSNGVAGGEPSAVTVVLVVVAASLLALATLAPALPSRRRGRAAGDVALAAGTD